MFFERKIGFLRGRWGAPDIEIEKKRETAYDIQQAVTYLSDNVTECHLGGFSSCDTEVI